MVMQVSTNSFYDGAATRMTTLMEAANRLQTQITTGKKIQNPSEDPAAAQKIAELDRQDANAGAYKSNMTIAASQLAQADSTLAQITDQLQRAMTLANQAATGTIDPASRKVLGQDLGATVDALVSLANTKDVKGQPLFGTPDGTVAVKRNADGTFTYAPTNVSEVPIADGQTVQATESATRIFHTADGTDTLKMLSDLASALQGGADGSVASTALDKMTAAANQVTTVQASVGAREQRIELQQTLQTTADADRAQMRSTIENVDITSAIADLQKTMTVLSAAQASFTKLTSLSLFNYLK